MKIAAWLAASCLLLGPVSVNADPCRIDCLYLAPEGEVLGDDYFYDLLDRSFREEETVSSILSWIEQTKDRCHRFEFKYPLENEQEAEHFAEVLQLKAREAHRFVPVMEMCEYVVPSRLGFSRIFRIKDGGPTVQEQVLVHPEAPIVIFIEQYVAVENGVVLPGTFACTNKIVQEHDCWYFVGCYLYNAAPSEEEIAETIQMFRMTFENMRAFSKNK